MIEVKTKGTKTAPTISIWNWCEEQFGPSINSIPNSNVAPTIINPDSTWRGDYLGQSWWTWSFKNERDAVLFSLKWSGR